MTKKVNVTIAPTAEWALKEIESYKSINTNPSEAANFVDELLLDSVDAITQDPTRYRYNSTLLDKGVRFREWIDAEKGYRVLYEEYNTNVDILLYSSTKQDYESLLYRYNIIR